jgi:transcriptional regulator with XRE-family HTH domain
MSARVERLMLELAAAMREEIGALPDNILTLGEELKAARANARMSLQEVADRSGFTKSHVWEVEQGRSRNPTIGMVAGLSKALGVPFLRLAQAALNSSEAPSISPAEGRAGTPATDDQKTPTDDGKGERP